MLTIRYAEYTKTLHRVEGLRQERTSCRSVDLYSVVVSTLAYTTLIEDAFADDLRSG